MIRLLFVIKSRAKRVAEGLNLLDRLEEMRKQLVRNRY